MRAASEILKNTVMTLLWFGITCAVFSYLAHFTEVQSVVLAVVTLYALSGYRLAVRIAAKQPSEFVPSRVWIELNWYSLCQEFGLADVEKWDELLEKCKACPTRYSIFDSGINFTMLSPTLFYCDDHHDFFDTEIRRRLQSLSFGSSHESRSNRCCWKVVLPMSFSLVCQKWCFSKTTRRAKGR